MADISPSLFVVKKLKVCVENQQSLTAEIIATEAIGKTMKRRLVIATTAGTLLGGLSGCLGDGDSDGTNDFDHGDYDIDDEGEVSGTDENGYNTYSVNGQDVPLVPTDDAYDWYENDDTVIFVDTRIEEQYEDLRISGAVFSPAADGLDENDPLDDVEKDTKIVTYCVCPHTLAGSRGAHLMENGYTNVYALDAGLQDWADRGYPMESGAL